MAAFLFREGHPSSRSRWVCGLLALSAGAAASPAAANPVGDCFERIAVAFHPHPHHPAVAPAQIHRVRHVRPRPSRPHRVAPANPTAAYAHRTRYVLRPIACETHPGVALMSPAPGAVLPQTPQALLAELAGPTAAAAPATAADVAEQAPVVAETLPLAPEVGGTFPGVPGGVFGGPGPVEGGVFVPGGPGPVTPVVTPPVVDVSPTTTDTPPTIIGQPPVVPGGPPTVIEVPPLLPPSGPPGGPPGGPAGGVPEPETWAMLILGAFGVGGVLRRRAAQVCSGSAAGGSGALTI